MEGHLKTRIIDKDDGTKLYKTEVVVDQLIFLSKREDFVEAGAEVSEVASFDDFSDLDTNKL